MTSKLKSVFEDFSEGEGLKAKIGRGVFWSFLGTFISKGLGVIGFIVIARILSVEDYGKLGIIRSTIATFAMFSVASFGTTATKYIAVYSQKDIRKTSRIITMTRTFVFILALVISMLVYFFSEYIAIHFLKEQSLEYAIRLTAPTIFFTAMNGLQNGILSGFEKFKYIANVNIINGLLGIPILILLTYFYGLDGTFTGLLVNSCLLWITSFCLVLKVLKTNNISIDFDDINKEFHIIKEFTLPAFLSGMIVSPVILISNLILTNSENGYKELGIYSAAFNFSIITATLNSIIGQVLYPYAMKYFKSDNKQFEFFNIVFPFFLGIIINLPIIIFPDLFSIVFGDKYYNEQMWFTLIFISFSTIIIAHRQGIARNFAAANYMWWSLISNFIWGVAALGLVYILVEYGSLGRASAFTIAYIINTIIFIPFYLNKKLIDKELILSKYSIVVWVLVLLPLFTIIYIDNFYLRAFYLVVTLLLIFVVLKKWLINYVGKNSVFV